MAPPHAQLFVRFVLQGRLNTKKRLFDLASLESKMSSTSCVWRNLKQYTTSFLVADFLVASGILDATLGISPFACSMILYLAFSHGWTRRSRNLTRKFGVASSM